MLHVDAEGHDFRVLKTLDFALYTPLVIFVEHIHLESAQKTEMKQFLCDQGYAVRDCGDDYFAVHKAAVRKAVTAGRYSHSIVPGGLCVRS